MEGLIEGEEEPMQGTSKGRLPSELPPSGFEMSLMKMEQIEFWGGKEKTGYIDARTECIDARTDRINW